MKVKFISKGQASLEILIIMGVLILVAIIFVAVFLSGVKKSGDNKGTDIVQQKMFSNFDSNLNEYEIPIQPGFNLNFLTNLIFSVGLFLLFSKIKHNNLFIFYNVYNKVI